MAIFHHFMDQTTNQDLINRETYTENKTLAVALICCSFLF